MKIKKTTLAFYCRLGEIVALWLKATVFRIWKYSGVLQGYCDLASVFCISFSKRHWNSPLRGITVWLPPQFLHKRIGGMSSQWGRGRESSRTGAKVQRIGRGSNTWTPQKPGLWTEKQNRPLQIIIHRQFIDNLYRIANSIPNAVILV